MRRATRVLAGATLALGLFGGDRAALGSASHETSTNSMEHLSAQQSNKVRTDFDTSIAFWERHNVGAVGLSKLVILEDNESFTCGGAAEGESTILDALSQPQFCSEQNTVVVSALAIEAETPLWVTFVVNHEVGHDVQNAKGTFNQLLAEEPASQELEMQATCYAGVSMAHENPSDINAIAMDLRKYSSDENHGSGSLQAKTFLTGVATGVC